MGEWPSLWSCRPLVPAPFCPWRPWFETRSSTVTILPATPPLHNSIQPQLRKPTKTAYVQTNILNPKNNFNQFLLFDHWTGVCGAERSFWKIRWDSKGVPPRMNHSHKLQGANLVNHTSLRESEEAGCWEAANRKLLFILALSFISQTGKITKYGLWRRIT